MQKTGFAILAVASVLALSPAGAQAAGAFVRQLDYSAPRGEVEGGSSAFVMQLPTDARPVPPAKPAPAKPVKRQFRKVVFIDQPAPDVKDSPAEALVPYPEGKQPKLPSVGTGVAVALVSSQSVARLPNIGSGVMN